MSKISLKHTDGNVVSLNSPTSAPTSADVAFKLPNADGSAGHFMKTDGSGNLSFSAVSGGITEADSWYLTSSFTGDATPISSNLARCDLSNDGFNKLGTGMSVSSGIWTFPSTGFWLVQGDLFYEGQSGYASRYNEFAIFATDDNSTYVEVARSGGYFDNYGSNRINSATSQAIIDCTDTSNVKIKFYMQVHDNTVTTAGSSSIYKTRFNFIRLADT